MRAFIALDLPYQIKNFITVQIFNLKTHFKYEDIKWVETQNYHITFKFFQDIDEKESIEKFEKFKSKIEEKMGKFVSQESLTKLLLSKELGFFYNSGKIRVIYLDIKPHEFFIEIHKVLEEFFGPSNFIPHLTIGRVKKKLSIKQEEILKNYRMEEIIFIPEEIALFKSTLTNYGPIYNKISIAKL